LCLPPSVRYCYESVVGKFEFASPLVVGAVYDRALFHKNGHTHPCRKARGHRPRPQPEQLQTDSPGSEQSKDLFLDCRKRVRGSLDSLVLDHTSGVDQRQMRKSLREVPDVPSCDWVVLFGKKAQMILDRKQTFEQFDGFILPPLKGVVVGKPEAAGEEGTLVAGKTVEILFSRVPPDKPFTQKFLLDGTNSRHHAGIICRQKTNERNGKHTCVERLR